MGEPSYPAIMQGATCLGVEPARKSGGEDGRAVPPTGECPPKSEPR